MGGPPPQAILQKPKLPPAVNSPSSSSPFDLIDHLAERAGNDAEACTNLRDLAPITERLNHYAQRVAENQRGIGKSNKVAAVQRAHLLSVERRPIAQGAKMRGDDGTEYVFLGNKFQLFSENVIGPEGLNRYLESLDTQNDGKASLYGYGS